MKAVKTWIRQQRVEIQLTVVFRAGIEVSSNIITDLLSKLVYPNCYYSSRILLDIANIIFADILTYSLLARTLLNLVR